jgi:K+-sensing histidine kinase KdpD
MHARSNYLIGALFDFFCPTPPPTTCFCGIGVRQRARKSQFLASMSHELRTPLNAIIGLTEMMVTNAARFGTEKAQEPLQRVNRAGTHLLGLINQVLDLPMIGM